MFKELGPLLRQRTVVMILTRLEDDTIRVNVIPRKLNESENDALTTPLSVAGTEEELDAELPSALVQFVGAHLELRNTLESAKEQMAAAGKAGGSAFKKKLCIATAICLRFATLWSRAFASSSTESGTAACSVFGCS